MSVSHVLRPGSEAGAGATPYGVSWCGRVFQAFDWHFLDAGHARANLHSASIRPCRRCVRALDRGEAQGEAVTVARPLLPARRPSWAQPAPEAESPRGAPCTT